jgi:2-polyprenyl-6-methoxyphenol hydroxylase-like FAD-dependent oxidoreductase
VTQPTVVISGAGIAGPALAHWLSATGCLADSLNGDRIRSALQRYETVMRPYIDRCQDVPRGIDGYLPKSASDIAITAQAMKWMQRWPFPGIAERKWFTTADAIELPEYPAP